MPKLFPAIIDMPCINVECSNILHLNLYQKYWKDKAYYAECNKCGIAIKIEKFSPFLNLITDMEEPAIPLTRIARSRPPMKSDISP